MSERTIKIAPGDIASIYQPGFPLLIGISARMSGEARDTRERIEQLVGGIIVGMGAESRPDSERAGWDFADRLIFLSDKAGYGKDAAGDTDVEP